MVVYGVLLALYTTKVYKLKHGSQLNVAKPQATLLTGLSLRKNDHQSRIHVVHRQIQEKTL